MYFPPGRGFDKRPLREFLAAIEEHREDLEHSLGQFANPQDQWMNPSLERTFPF